MSVSANVRNVVIVLVLAALVDLVPGGGTVANVIIQGVYLVFLGALVWVAAVMYRQHRSTLDSLGDRKRAGFYFALATLAVTLTATHRLWTSAAGEVAWLALVGIAVYVGATVLWSARRY